MTALELQNVTDEDIKRICELYHLRVLTLENPQLQNGYAMLVRKKPPVLALQLNGDIPEEGIQELQQTEITVYVNGEMRNMMMEMPQLPW
ncbi:hypothetical protein HYZ99_00425 [Candidatus Peregrinibacteria bacterium]|nr:hypothetical protein [Candidatus Peregrinibacteria bacterium]